MPRNPNYWKPEYDFITSGFGERLLDLMDGMSIRELARRSSVSESTLNNWIKGRTVPDIVRIFAIAQCLPGGASIDWLVGLDEDGAPTPRTRRLPSELH